MINKTIPKDKSNKIYYSDSGRYLKSSKDILIIYKLNDYMTTFTKGNYVHSRKTWLDQESFYIPNEDVLGWIDVDDLIK